MTNLIEVNGLKKAYKDFSLDNVSFSLPTGCIMGFVGPNGAGKSTTIKLMLNIIEKDEGEAKLFGLDSVEDEIKIKEQIGFVLDDTFLPENLTAPRAGWFISGFYKSWDQKLYEHYMEKFKLPKDKKIKSYSTGMKAKLNIALALSHRARLLILDEPTSGLDPVVRAEILDELLKVVEDPECGVFFSTHITSDLDKTADYVTFIEKGQILLSTTRDEISENYCIVKGGKNQLHDVQDTLLGFEENQFGFSGLSDNAPGLKRLFGDKLVYEKASIEDVLLYFDKEERKTC